MIVPWVGSPIKIVLVVDGSPYSVAAVDLLTHMTWPAGTFADVLVLVPERLPHLCSPPGVPGALAETSQNAHWRDWAAAKVLARYPSGQPITSPSVEGGHRNR